MNFKRAFIVTALACLSVPQSAADRKAREAAVEDLQTLTKTIVRGLGNLATPAATYRFKREKRETGEVKGKAPKRTPTPAGPRTLNKDRTTVNGRYEIQILEWRDRFVLNVRSDTPAQTIIVKDVGKRIELSKKPLNDQMEYSIEVPYPLTADTLVSVAVNPCFGSGELCLVRDAFKILE